MITLIFIPVLKAKQSNKIKALLICLTIDTLLFSANFINL